MSGDGRKIFAHNFPFEWGLRDVEDQFSEIGKLSDVYLLKKRRWVSRVPRDGTRAGWDKNVGIRTGRDKSRQR